LRRPDRRNIPEVATNRDARTNSGRLGEAGAKAERITKVSLCDIGGGVAVNVVGDLRVGARAGGRVSRGPSILTTVLNSTNLSSSGHRVDTI